VGKRGTSFRNSRTLAHYLCALNSARFWAAANSAAFSRLISKIFFPIHFLQIESGSYDSATTGLIAVVLENSHHATHCPPVY
jgi:hypothetical protein